MHTGRTSNVLNKKSCRMIFCSRAPGLPVEERLGVIGQLIVQNQIHIGDV